MERPDAGEVGDLVPARRAAGHQHVTIAQGPRGGQQPPLSDGARHLEVLTRISEGAGHPAAAGIEIDDGGAGDAAEQGLCGGQAAHRLLMTVRVEEDLRRSAAEIEV